MTPKDLLGLFVRLGGLLMCLYGLHTLITTVWSFLLILVFGSLGSELINLALELAPGFGWLLGGAALLHWADRVVRVAYPAKAIGVCGNCGYDLRGTPGRCPECGTPAAPA